MGVSKRGGGGVSKRGGGFQKGGGGVSKRGAGFQKGGRGFKNGGGGGFQKGAGLKKGAGFHMLFPESAPKSPKTRNEDVSALLIGRESKVDQSEGRKNLLTASP